MEKSEAIAEQNGQSLEASEQIQIQNQDEKKKKKKEKKPSYIIEFPVHTEKFQEDSLAKRIELFRKIYNSVLIGMKKVYLDKKPEIDAEVEMHVKKNLADKAAGLDKKDKDGKSTLGDNGLYKGEYSEIVNKMCHVSDFKFPKGVTPGEKISNYSLFAGYGTYAALSTYIKTKIGGFTEKGKNITYSDIGMIGKAVNFLSNRLKAASSKYIYENKSLHIKSKKDFNTITIWDRFGIAKEQGYPDIEFTDSRRKHGNEKFFTRVTVGYKINKKILYFSFDAKTDYDIACINAIRKDGDPIGSNEKLRGISIARREIRGKMKYFIQLNIEGVPFGKGRKPGNHKVGIDPGTSEVVSYVQGGKNKFPIYRISKRIADNVKKKKALQRKISRIEILTWPECIKDKKWIKGKRVDWSKASKRYWELRAKVKDTERRIGVWKTELANVFANRLISEANKIMIEKNEINQWVKKKTETKKDEKGRFEKKKQHGRSVSLCAPGKAIETVKRKAAYHKIPVLEIDPHDAKATGVDFMDNLAYTKYPTTVRDIKMKNGDEVDRDARAAFNLSHFNGTKYNVKKMSADYQNFKDCQDIYKNERSYINKLRKTCK